MGRQSLESWLVEAMVDEEKPGKCAAISLVHIVGEGGIEREIYAVRFGTKVWKETELAELFRHKANGYCQDIPGSQLFCLLAYYGESKEPLARHPFRVNPSTEIGGLGALTTEAPNETGQRQQNMRLAEALVQGAFRERALLIDQLLRSNEILGRHNRQLIEEQQVMTENYRALILANATTNHEFKMKELAAQQQGAMLQAAKEYLPVVVNALTGKEIIPNETVDSALLKLIASHITPDHVNTLASTLPPEVMGPLAKRLVDIRTDIEKKEAEGKRRLTVVTGEEDVVGGKGG